MWCIYMYVYEYVCVCVCIVMIKSMVLCVPILTNYSSSTSLYMQTFKYRLLIKYKENVATHEVNSFIYEILYTTCVHRGQTYAGEFCFM